MNKQLITIRAILLFWSVVMGIIFMLIMPQLRPTAPYHGRSREYWDKWYYTERAKEGANHYNLTLRYFQAIGYSSVEALNRAKLYETRKLRFPAGSPPGGARLPAGSR